MDSILTKFPSKITAGLSFQAIVAYADYPAPDWALAGVVRGPKSIDLIATAEGSAHSFTVAAAESASFTAGLYWYSLRATKGADVVEVEKGQVTILADLSVAEDGFDGRTENEKALDSIKAVLAKRATQDQQKYTINNRELWRTPIADLLKLRGFYAAAVRREKAIQSGSVRFGRSIPVRFS